MDGNPCITTPPRQTAGQYRSAVFIKGIVLDSNGVAPVRNDRGEWGLPGGRLELGESQDACVVREVGEELGLIVRVGRLVDAWL